MNFDITFTNLNDITMGGILDLLQSDIGKTLISGAGRQLNLDKGSATAAMSSAIPLILGALKNNASTPDGASGLLRALGSSQHSNGGLGSILGGDNIDDDVMQDGSKILGHVFGGQEKNAANVIGSSSGIDMKSAMKVMQVAAPIVMSYLGRKSSNEGVSDQKGLDSLLGGLLGGTEQKIASKVQGFDNNDSSIEDIAGMLLGKGSGGGIGSLLGGFLKNM